MAVDATDPSRPGHPGTAPQKLPPGMVLGKDGKP